MKSLDLTNLANSIRGDALERLQATCDEYSLSYAILEEENVMTIELPVAESPDIPVLSELKRPLEDHLAA